MPFDDTIEKTECDSELIIHVNRACSGHIDF